MVLRGITINRGGRGDDRSTYCTAYNVYGTQALLHWLGGAEDVQQAGHVQQVHPHHSPGHNCPHNLKKQKISQYFYLVNMGFVYVCI